MKEKEFFKRLISKNQEMASNYPKKQAAHEFISLLSNFLFPVCKDKSHDYNVVNVEWEYLKLKLKELLIPINGGLKQDLDLIVNSYFEKIPEIYDRLILDAEAINQFDPASYSVEEIILAYPGFQAILTYRLAHPLYEMKVPILPRLLSEYAHSNTGIDINPGAQIGNSFFIDHGTGVVIGETTVIGNNVKIYQGVTLGALSVKKEEAKTKRHPTIEDNVIVYSGTTILGGKTTIGHDSVVGGNVWLTKSLEPFSIVYNVSEIEVRNGKEANEPINFVI